MKTDLKFPRQKQNKRMAQPVSKAKLILRTAELSDIPAIVALSERVFAPHPGSTAQMIRARINNFKEGQFVAVYEGKVVGYCGTFIIGEDAALSPHTWDQITGNGFASRHDPDGDYLYGMEVSVDPAYRRLRIGQRLYKLRRNLCESWGLKGVVFGGRMPGYGKRRKQFPDPVDYIAAVKERRLRDSVINFHLSNDFEPIGVLPRYDTSDEASAGFAAHMLWRNPLYTEKTEGRAATLSMLQTVRVATVQWQMRRLSRKEDFSSQVEYFVDVASDYRCDFVVFPEFFTNQLLTLEDRELPPKQAIEHVADHTDWFLDFMSRQAVSYNINIVGGTHPRKEKNGDITNVCYVFLRDGSVHARPKIHPTPSEVYWWGIKGGSHVEPINTDCGPIGIMVCYDAEFPELARHLVDQGAMILFVPSCTDEPRAFLRVRYCCHARAIENQCYVVLSGVVGNLPNVENMEIHYAESCILTPCDFAFPRDGVAADTGPNTETVAIGDLHLSDLREARSAGAVRNLRDRRFDLYRVAWR